MKSINTRPSRITPRSEWDSFDKYLQDVTRCSGNVLSADEEVELFRKVKEWDEAAREKFVKANLRFVVSVAKQYVTPGVHLQDLVEEWNVWLLKAVDRFDETRGFKFISYAVWWIRQSILQFLSQNNNTIRLPMNQKAYQSRINKFKEKFLQEYKRRPSDQEIINWLKLKDGELQKYYDMVKTTNVKRFSDRINDDDDSEFWDTIENVNTPSPSAEIEQKSIEQEILKILNAKRLPTRQSLKPTNKHSAPSKATSKQVLTLREREVIKMLFWLEGRRPMTLEEVWERLDISRERVRWIKLKAIEKLKLALQWTEFEDLYNDLNN